LAAAVARIEALLDRGDPQPIDKLSPEEIQARLDRVVFELEDRLDAHTPVPASHDVTDAAAALAELNEISAEQASYLEEANTAADRMQSSIIENSRLARTAAEAATELGTRTETRTTEILSVVSRLQASAEQASASLATIFDVGNSSNEIAGMARTINEIAEQTKILAFNAAIAAARAGDQGKEFGVISGEIRQLATRTADTAREITKVIGDLETETREAASVMQQVDVGLEDVDQAGDALHGIAAETNQLIEAVNQIAHHSKSQSAATSDVLFGIDAAAMTGEQLLDGVRRLGDFVDRVADGEPR
jgi:methyl-accepting chemotaxis protein